MEFYTNVSQYGNKIRIIGYNETGKFKKEINYKPYLFVNSDDETSPYRTVYGDVVSKIEFPNIINAKEFIEKYKYNNNFPIYGLEKFAYVYVYDTYKNMQYDINKIAVRWIDIETEYSNTFPSIELADQPITAITFSNGKTYITFGVKDYTPSNPNIKYIKCLDEKEMLQKFLTLWEHPRYAPDVISGWNIQGFDLPYLINRISRLWSREEAARLSPWKLLTTNRIEYKGTLIEVPSIVGVSVLDYLDLVKRYKEEKFENYTLEFISTTELGVGKLDYSNYNGLMDMYEKDHQRYIDYNIIDVQRCVELDRKNKLIELVYALAYFYGVNFHDVFTTVSPWDVKVHNFLMDSNIVIPPKKENLKEEYSGGFVKEPKLGESKWVVSYDLNSLYPHIIMSYNISPETYMGKLEDNLTLDDMLNNVLFDNKGCSVTSNLCMFTNSKQGFMPKIMQELYEGRKKYKKLMLQAEELYNSTKDENYQYDIAKYHNIQWSMKIALNSFYGCLGNIYFRWFKKEYAEAITTTGRLGINWVINDVNSYLNTKFKTINDEYVIMGDTDSIYICLEKYANQYSNLNNKDISKKLYEFCVTDLLKVIDTSFYNLHKYTNSYENKLIMKVEGISEKTIVAAKKRYISALWSNEGIFYDEIKIKIKGLEVVKSNIPKVCKDDIKECIKLILTKDVKYVRSFISSVREKFKNTYTLEEIAKPQGVGDLSKYISPTGNAMPGAQAHFRAAINYNKLIDKFNLERKYSKIYNNDKIKILYLKIPNIVGENVIGFKKEFPVEFNINKYIDIDEQFDSTFLKPLKIITDSIQWNISNTRTIDEAFDTLPD